MDDASVPESLHGAKLFQPPSGAVLDCDVDLNIYWVPTDVGLCVTTVSLSSLLQMFSEGFLA